VLAYLVIPTNSAGQEVVDWSKAIQVPVACPFDFFFGAMAGKCPELPNPERASAAFRTFERSFMVCGQVIPYLCSFPMARGNFTPIFGPREHLSPLLTRHRPPDCKHLIGASAICGQRTKACGTGLVGPHQTRSRMKQHGRMWPAARQITTESPATVIYPYPMAGLSSWSRRKATIGGASGSM
jgi:hypothetical protein